MSSISWRIRRIQTAMLMLLLQQLTHPHKVYNRRIKQSKSLIWEKLNESLFLKTKISLNFEFFIVQITNAHNKSSTISQTCLQIPATRKFFRDIFCPKMLMTEDSGGGNNKAVLSVSSLDKWTPPIPSLSVLGKLEEMITCTSTVYIIGAIIAVKGCTILSSSLSRGGGCFPDA